MNRWQIGEVSVTRVVEMEVTGGSRFILPDATREEIQPIEWLTPHFADEDGRLIMSVHALIVDTGERRLIVDTCIGNDKTRKIPNWSNLQLPFLEDLTAAGYPPDSIDTVLCTHLHVDHVGWNTMLVDGKWVPTFKNARYLIGEKEWAYWNLQDDDDEYGPIMSDSVRPIFDAGLVDLVDMEHRVTPEVRLVPTPGHTPGHVSVLIESKGETALITGDWLHHPCQMARPQWRSSADFDQDAAETMRRKLLADYADGPTLIIGTHFAAPTAGYVKSDGKAWRLEV